MFKRRIKQENNRKSTGIEEIDKLLGGQLKNGSILLLVQGEDVKYHLGMHRIFLAQGLEQDESVLHYSKDNPKLSAPAVQHPEKNTLEKIEQSKIAWRYETMSRTGNTAGVGGSTISSARKFNLKIVNPKDDQVISLEDGSATEILFRLEVLIEEQKTRISLSSLFSPIWSTSQKEVNDFFFGLRALVRRTESICMVSVPVYLLDRFKYSYFDYVINLEKNSLRNLKYDGLIQPLKTETNDFQKYGLTCQSTGIKIEKVVLPPE